MNNNNKSNSTVIILSDKESYRINQIPSLKWVVQNNTGSLIHELCKRSKDNQRSLLSRLQVGWATLDMIVAVCSPHTYHKSITFQMDTFDKIFTYYQSAFEQEHFAVDNAVLSGNFELVEYLLDKGTPFTTNAIDNACSKGYLDIIKLLLNTTPRNDPLLFDDNIKFTNHAYDNAATNGHLNVILYLDQLREQYQKGESKYRVEFTVKAIDGAAKNKHWNVVNHILDKYKKDGEMKGYLLTSEALQWCIADNNFEMLNKLFNYAHSDKGWKKCGNWSTNGLSMATEQGNMDMIKWIIDQKLVETLQGHTVSCAVEGNHIRIIQYFLDVHKKASIRSGFRTFPFDFALNFAVIGKRVEIFQMLFFACLESNAGFDLHMIMELACKSDCIEIMTFIMDNYALVMNELIVEKAASYGRLEILKFVIDEKGGVVRQADIEECAESASIECMEYLLSKFTGALSSRTLKLACRRGCKRMIEHILLRYNLDQFRSLIPTFFEAAVASGSIECIDIIRNAYVSIGPDTDTPLITIKSLGHALENGHLHVIKHLIDVYPQILDPSTDQPEDEELMVEFINESINRRFYTSVEYLLSIKADRSVQTLVSEESQTTTPEYRFKATNDVLQMAIETKNISLIEMIHRYRPHLTSVNPAILLADGYIEAYQMVMLWNQENGFNHAESNPYYFHDTYWFKSALVSGNIALIQYIVNEKKLLPIPFRSKNQHDVAPKQSHLQTIYYIRKEIQDHISTYCIANLSLFAIMSDSYSALKVNCNKDTVFQYFSDYHTRSANNNNLSILRLLLKRTKNEKINN
ncbi:hypothetical protein DFA_06233 [Cavenderia fasciculata]|uniref:Ankyrin repeat-containing protein n=1 Tax=Cavenderia fasciculata TaxID=261658 RepID=F4PKH0_CACFS|nr:uncharacterized protein DFA_06233 [Cavenderia fasciculata]EGG24094.1 hypothetical protein DFA_06233 [Cavenderia fasciculata]|eukprot:XP_004361945.1 hypothetical protein DFA_06233 [Cavenderia fasciculata]